MLRGDSIMPLTKREQKLFDALEALVIAASDQRSQNIEAAVADAMQVMEEYRVAKELQRELAK
jgi:hypothetical protein